MTSRRATHILRAAIAIVIVAPLALVPMFAWETCGFGKCPDVRRLRYFQPGGAPMLLDRDGKPFSDLAPPERSIVPLDELPQHLPAAFLAVEDQRFYDHNAIDWRRVAGAALANWRRGEIVQGSSTITMQLARSVFPEELPLDERTLRRKALEVRVASEIERVYSKHEILELYLNHVYMGRGLYGVENAAREFFGVSARQVTLAQAAMLAAMVKAPGQYDPRRHPKVARQRRDLVLALLAKRQPSVAAAAEVASKTSLAVSLRLPDRRMTGPAPYFVEQVRRELEEKFGGRPSAVPTKIRTTIDPRIQLAAEEELQAQLRAIEKGSAGKFEGPIYNPGGRANAPETDYLQGAVVVIDARQGDVLAWVGGRDFSQSRFDRVAAARRQAGSSFKPFVYAAAISGGHPLSKPLDDSPITIALDRKHSWTPRNVRGHHVGILSMRDALVRSNNTATVRLAEEVGLDAIAGAARSAGLVVDNVQPSLTLGAIHVTPLEMTSAYSAFANEGTRVTPRLILEADDRTGHVLWKPGVEKRRAFDAATAYLVTDVLSDVIRRGTGKEANPKRAGIPVAGKTGTTNDVTDAWFIGYTPELIAAVWIGFDRPRPVVDEATAARLAAPLWGRLVDRIYTGRAIPLRWSPPAGVEKATFDVASGLPLEEGCRTARMGEELFIGGKLAPLSCPYGDTIGSDFAVRVAPLPGFTILPGTAAGQEEATTRPVAPDAAPPSPEPERRIRPYIWPPLPEPQDRTRTYGAPSAPESDARTDAPSREVQEYGPPAPPRDVEAYGPPAPQRDGRDYGAPAPVVEGYVRTYESPLDERRAPAYDSPVEERRARAVASPPSPERGVRTNVSAPSWAYDRGSRDLSGSWNLTTQIRSTTVPEFQNLRLGYRIELEQRGGRIFGRGRKLSEDGKPLAGAASTAIEFDGIMRGEQQLVLTFRERGTRRTSGGTFSLSVSPDWRGLGGTFESSAAETRGSAVATRVE